VRRFLAGIALGATAGGITYAVGHNATWTAVAAIFGALLAWAGPAAFEFLADVIDDL